MNGIGQDFSDFMKEQGLYEEAQELATKKLIARILLLLFPLLLYAHGITLQDHAQITELSSFTVAGVLDLRTGKDTTASPTYRTLNHEGGVKVTVLEILKDAVHENQHGLWLSVLLTAPLWADNGDWIEKYQKFLIFLPDEMPVFDFEE